MADADRIEPQVTDIESDYIVLPFLAISVMSFTIDAIFTIYFSYLYCRLDGMGFENTCD